jgi:hypothetical protein
MAQKGDEEFTSVKTSGNTERRSKRRRRESKRTKGFKFQCINGFKTLGLQNTARYAVGWISL